MPSRHSSHRAASLPCGPPPARLAACATAVLLLAMCCEAGAVRPAISGRFAQHHGARSLLADQPEVFQVRRMRSLAAAHAIGTYIRIRGRKPAAAERCPRPRSPPHRRCFLVTAGDCHLRPGRACDLQRGAPVHRGLWAAAAAAEPAVGEPAGPRLPASPARPACPLHARTRSPLRPPRRALQLFTITGVRRVDVVYAQQAGQLHVLAYVPDVNATATVTLTVSPGVARDAAGATNAAASASVIYRQAASQGSAFGSAANLGFASSMAVSFGAAILSPGGAPAARAARRAMPTTCPAPLRHPGL